MFWSELRIYECIYANMQTVQILSFSVVDRSPEYIQFARTVKHKRK